MPAKKPVKKVKDLKAKKNPKGGLTKQGSGTLVLGKTANASADSLRRNQT